MDSDTINSDEEEIDKDGIDEALERSALPKTKELDSPEVEESFLESDSVFLDFSSLEQLVAENEVHSIKTIALKGIHLSQSLADLFCQIVKENYNTITCIELLGISFDDSTARTIFWSFLDLPLPLLKDFHFKSMDFSETLESHVFLRLNATSDLLSLSFDNVSMKQQHISQLADFFHANQTLQRFSLKNPKIDTESIDMKPFCKAIQNLDTLCEVLIADVDIPAQYSNELFNCLFSHRSIESIKLCRVYPLRNFIMNSRFLSFPRNLRDVAFKECSLESRHSDRIFCALQKCAYLEKVDVFGNALKDVGMNAVTVFLKNCSSCRLLDLGNNLITEKGAQTLAQAFKEHDTLRNLHLNSNSIGSKGCKALLCSLENSSTLEELCLHSNELDESCNDWISSFISSNTSVTQLDLGYNSLASVNGDIPFIDSVLHNQSLKSLDLSFNGIASRGLNRISQLLRAEPCLEILNLIGNDCRNSVKILEDAILHNFVIQDLMFFELTIQMDETLTRNRSCKSLWTRELFLSQFYNCPKQLLELNLLNIVFEYSDCCKTDQDSIEALPFLSTIFPIKM